MEIKNALVLDGNEPLSKALGSVLDTGTAVIVSKKGKYYGIIDDRNFRKVGENPSKVKCGTVVVKPPVITPETSLWERTTAFLLGHFKALPVINENDKPLGIITRVEVLKELQDIKVIPKISVKNLMSIPVYTIEESKKVGDAKSKMREYKARRLVVLRRGKPVGIFSTMDFASFALKPKKKEKKASQLTSRRSVEDEPLANFYRSDVKTIDVKATVEEAAKLMITKETSNVVVLSNNKPVGVISALDIFKWIKSKATEETMIEISGLSKDTRRYYDDIREGMANAIKKFTRTYGIRKVHVHVKKTKSFYSLNIRVDGRQNFVVSSEAPSLEETIKMSVSELKKIFRRKKGIEKSMKVRRKGGLL